MARHQRDPRKEQFWRRTLRQWQRSGLTIRDCCAQRQLSEPSFYFCRRLLERRDQEQTAAPTPPTPAASPPVADEGPLFVPLRLTASPALEVVLPNGLVVRVPASFEP